MYIYIYQKIINHSQRTPIESNTLKMTDVLYVYYILTCIIKQPFDGTTGIGGGNNFVNTS